MNQILVDMKNISIRYSENEKYSHWKTTVLNGVYTHTYTYTHVVQNQHN